MNDLHISIPILFGILIQSGALFYWGGKLSQSVKTLQGIAGKHDNRIRKLEMGFDTDD